jgi:hypothetical protein
MAAPAQCWPGSRPVLDQRRGLGIVDQDEIAVEREPIGLHARPLVVDLSILVGQGCVSTWKGVVSSS